MSYRSLHDDGSWLVRGRLLDATDRAESPTVCLVDEVFAAHTLAVRRSGVR